MADIVLGTSGWHYAHWVGRFYPGDLSRQEWLAYYTERFRAVEVNNSFYRLPDASTVDAWREHTPPDFLFTVKAPRSITHLKKLRNTASSLELFLGRVQRLGTKLGPILFQLPPHWHCNAQRLAEFLALLPEGLRYTFEFRDPSWHTEQVYEVMASRNAAFCIFDLKGFTAPLKTTADFVYVRLHGPGKQAYTGSYSSATLRTWAGRAKRWANREQRDVYVFFDNDQNAYAVKNATHLQTHLVSPAT